MSERTILDLCDDPAVFAPWFRDKDTWRAWRAFLSALFGLSMPKHLQSVFKRCTGRTESPTAVTEAWLVVGRRGGKSFVLALTAVFLACFRDWRRHLTPGERGVVMIIATDRKQAGVIFSYIRALLLGVPMLARQIEGTPRAESIDLANSISIEIHTASFRTIRGRTVVAALLDECAFWRSDDSANPDREILAALRPAMATVPGSLLLAASSPYARRGVLYDAWRDHHGKAGPVLVWRADTRTMNPSVPQAVIDEAYERDPVSAAAEYGAEFRTDVQAFVDRAVVDACVVPGRRELRPIGGVVYSAFADPSGGSSDSMTLAIGHVEKTGQIVIDAMRERKPPFSPESVVVEFAELLKSYHVHTVKGDRYAGEWPAERFRAHQIHYAPAGKPKSELYLNALPQLNAARVELLDDRKLVTQICSLERRTARGGKDSIDHAPGAHDDVANAVLGLVATLDRPRSEPRILILDGPAPERHGLSSGAQPFTGGDFGSWIRGN